MKSSILQTGNFKLNCSKVMMTIAIASVTSSLFITPVFAERGDGHDRGDRRGNHGQHGPRGGHVGPGYRPGYWQEYRQPYVYAQPVYVPPPVYYEPRQSPGITLFFPLDLR
jgi:hypothetical protein